MTNLARPAGPAVITALRPRKPLDPDRVPVFISYDQAERLITSLLDRVLLWAPDAVAGIARGGLVPATMAACMLALPLFIIAWDRKSGLTRWIGDPPAAPNRILLVDDACSTGTTMAAVRSALVDWGYACTTLTVLHDPDTTGYVPDFSHPMRELFRFPWERGEATPLGRTRRATGAPSELAAERLFFGLDLDGVFVPDISRTGYEADLAATLRKRQALAPFAVLPPFSPERAVVITGRPECDRGDTETWLARWGFQGLKLECRPNEVGADLASVARYKAITATRWGCTNFIESEPEQAIRIAALAPHLVVSWWSAAETRAWVIGAASPPGPLPAF
ncbi:MAG: phosphoribosyltransferase [Alphaproteobacteria bacterium]|nr:phosphoribosyltransferase [Alphaproteobacteria bacterium]